MGTAADFKKVIVIENSNQKKDDPVLTAGLVPFLSVKSKDLNILRNLCQMFELEIQQSRKPNTFHLYSNTTETAELIRHQLLLVGILVLGICNDLSLVLGVVSNPPKNQKVEIDFSDDFKKWLQNKNHFTLTSQIASTIKKFDSDQLLNDLAPYIDTEQIKLSCFETLSNVVVG